MFALPRTWNMPITWMFLCLLLGPFTLATSSGAQNRYLYLNVPQTVLDKASLGVDPVYSDLFGQTDPGMKDQIFESTRMVDGTVVLNDFIGKAVKELRCETITSSSVESIVNFNSYLEHESESVSFNTGAGFSLGFSSGFSISASVGYGRRDSEESMKLVKFFQETSGEIIQSSSRCHTHVVSLNMNAKAVFTKLFIASLRKLNTEAKKPRSEWSREVFREFVADFGTHFQDETIFGAQVMYESRFAQQAASTSELNERQDCVGNSFSASLGVGVGMFQVEQTFEKESEQCTLNGNDRQTLANLGISSVKISSVGAPPALDSLIWQDVASENPVPLKYRLEKISTLFLTDWFESVFESDQPDQSSADSINGTAMHEFFEVLSAEYCQIMMGMSCEVISKGCGYSSNCTLGEKCIPDESPSGFTCQKGCGITDNCSKYETCFNNTNSLSGYDCKKGCQYTHDCPPKTTCENDYSEKGYTCLKPCQVQNICPKNEKCYEESNSAAGYICVLNNYETTLIAGGKTKAPWSNGKYTGLSKKTRNSRTSTTYSNLYRGVYLNALAHSNRRLYMCGGRQNDWKGSMYHTTDCYGFSTSPPFSGRSRIIDLPTTAYFISAASIGSDAVWFIVSNKLHKLNSRSEKFTTVSLPFSASGVHCTVANGSHAYVIGAGSGKNEIWVNKEEHNEKSWQRVGYLSKAREWHDCLWYGSNIMITGGTYIRKDVEMFNTETNKRWTGVPLPKGRHGHRMMIYDGKPTVLGGWGGSYFLNDMVSFDPTTKKWTTLWRKMSEAKEAFALVQY